MMQDKVVVALNGQINPRLAGGTESSVMSLVKHLAPQRDSICLKFISLPAYSDSFREVAPFCTDVIDWPFQSSYPISGKVKSAQLQRLRRHLGPARRLLDQSVRLYRLARRRLPNVEQCDAVLEAEGVDVVHFGWPTTFPTSLPFIYEPQDLQHYHYPEFFLPDVLAWRTDMYLSSARAARFLVCGIWWTK